MFTSQDLIFQLAAVDMASRLGSYSVNQLTTPGATQILEEVAQQSVHKAAIIVEAAKTAMKQAGYFSLSNKDATSDNLHNMDCGDHSGSGKVGKMSDSVHS